MFSNTHLKWYNYSLRYKIELIFITEKIEFFVRKNFYNGQFVDLIPKTQNKSLLNIPEVHTPNFLKKN